MVAANERRFRFEFLSGPIARATADDLRALTALIDRQPITQVLRQRTRYWILADVVAEASPADLGVLKELVGNRKASAA